MKRRFNIKTIFGLLFACGLCIKPLTSVAGKKLEIDETRWLSIGAGIRTEFSSIEDSAPNGEDSSADFNVQSMRFYFAGQAHEYVKFTINTEKIDDDIDVLDAIVQLELSPQFNVWMGRMLTPADRIEMNGPYYGINWNQYIVPLYASDQGGEAGRIGRDNGVTVWGAANKFQYSFGIFDGLQGGANIEDNLLYATRLAYNFLNMEKNPAYYTSSGYAGSLGDVFTVGFSAQSQASGVGNAQNSGDFSGYAIDVFYEGVLDSGAVVNIDAEFKDFDSDITTADIAADEDCFCLFRGDSYFVTAAYLLSKKTGVGKFQPYVRYTENNPDDLESQDLIEFGTNYIISGFNLLFNFNVTSGNIRPSGEDTSAITFGMQLQI